MRRVSLISCGRVGCDRASTQRTPSHPELMGPPPHPALQRLIDIRAADTSFALDELSRLARIAPSSPLAGHLELDHVGIAGHSLGGATARSEERRVGKECSTRWARDEEKTK